MNGHPVAIDGPSWPNLLMRSYPVLQRFRLSLFWIFMGACTGASQHDRTAPTESAAAGTGSTATNTVLPVLRPSPPTNARPVIRGANTSPIATLRSARAVSAVAARGAPELTRLSARADGMSGGRLVATRRRPRPRLTQTSQPVVSPANALIAGRTLDPAPARRERIAIVRAPCARPCRGPPLTRFRGVSRPRPQASDHA